LDVFSQQCLISFGSNLGDRNALLAKAARIVAADARVHRLASSRLYETPPIGGPGGQEPFLNAVAAFDTDASAAQILSLLQRVENDLGRDRKQRWGSRSIDLDVVLHGELIGGSRGLVVPHPRYTARRFVLRPACDVAGHYRDPRFGWTLRRLADHLDLGVASMALVGGSASQRSELCRRLRDQPGLQVFETAFPIDDDEIDSPWVSAFVPDFPPGNTATTESSGALDCSKVPRLVTRLQTTRPHDRWPAPHQMWPSGWNWPQYRLELDDMQWAAGEVVSALQSMRCPLIPVTDDGDWWK
jgi:2-amino-4-hydroxy-6-hydroxymethyldihydropteridine diphosphokinase